MWCRPGVRFRCRGCSGAMVPEGKVQGKRFRTRFLEVSRLCFQGPWLLSSALLPQAADMARVNRLGLSCLSCQVGQLRWKSLAALY